MDDAVLQLVDYVLANAPAALREACSRDGILAGLERVGAFDVCCFGKLCKFGAEAAASLAECGSCGSKMHRLCATENAWLKWLNPESTAVMCFECRLLERRCSRRQRCPLSLLSTTDSRQIGAALASPM